LKHPVVYISVDRVVSCVADEIRCTACTEEKGHVDTPCFPDGSCLDVATVCDSATSRCQCDDQHYNNGSRCRT